MELSRIAIRAIFAYIFLLALIRTSGKRTIAQSTAFDFVVALILGDMIDDLLWSEVPASQFVVGIGSLMMAHVLVSIAAARNIRFASLVEGTATMFMRAGSFLKPAMRKEHINEKEAAEMLRLEGLTPDRREEVKSAWIELSGKTAILEQEWARTAQKKDLPALQKLKQ